MPFKWVRRRKRAGRAAWTSSQSRHRNKERAVSGSPFFFAAHAYKWPGVASAPDPAAWTSNQSCHRNKERAVFGSPFFVCCRSILVSFETDPMARCNQPQIAGILTVLRADDYLSYVRASGFQLSGGLCLVGPTGRFGFDVRQARSTAAGGNTCAFWLSGSGARSGQWLFLFPGLE